MYMLDSLGFNLMGKTLDNKDWINARLPFPYILETESEVRVAIAELVEKLEE